MSPDQTDRRVLLFGCNGQVGRELVRMASGLNVAVTPLSRSEVDIVNRQAVERALLKHPCDVVINAAAYTAVDKAESDRDTAFAVNRDGPALIAELCRDRGLPMIHFSTDYVFDGLGTGAYREQDPVNPLGVYGASKAAGEQAIRDTWERHVILRTAWVYGVQGHNFVRTMLRLGAEKPELRIVDDQVGCPTSARSIAAATFAIAEAVNESTWGTYHYCDAGRTTWYGFAEEIFRCRAELTGQAGPRLHPISTAEYPTPAPRPANSVLDCARLADTFGIRPPARESELRAVLRELVSRGTDQ